MNNGLASPVDIFPYLEPNLRATITDGQLTVGLLIISVLLGICSYTDLHWGKRIPDRFTIPLLVAAIAVVPLIAEDPGQHYRNGIALAIFSALLVIFGGQGAADLKLYFALGLLLGRAGWALYGITQFVSLLYGLPMLWWAKHRGEVHRWRGFGIPMGPAIAISWLVVLAIYGADAKQIAGLAGATLVGYGAMRWRDARIARLESHKPGQLHLPGLD